MKTILVVDDNSIVRETTHMILEGMGYDVVTADGPEQAKKCLSEVIVDLVVCDLFMSDADNLRGSITLAGGMDTIVEISANYPNIPVIAMSGAIASNYSTNSFKKFGASVVLAKPFSEKQLLGAIYEALNGSTQNGYDSGIHQG